MESPGSDVFTPLELEDRVTIMALFYEIVREVQVEQAWRVWRGKPEKERFALWRVLAEQPDVDPESIRSVAAQLYGFEEAELPPGQAVRLLRELFQSFSTAQWEQMIERLVVPVAVGVDPRTGNARLVFATHDPVRPEATRLLQQLPLDGFEVQYAPEADLLNVLHEALDQPWFEGATELTARLAARDLRHQAPPEPSLPEEPEASDELDEAFARHSTAAWFDSVLVALHRQQAQEAQIRLDYRRALEVQFVREGESRLWRTEHHVHPEGLLAYLVDELLDASAAKEAIVTDAVVQRWIDDTLIRFQVQLHPVADEQHGGQVIIRMLGRREALKERHGLGPWKAP